MTVRKLVCPSDRFGLTVIQSALSGMLLNNRGEGFADHWEVADGVSEVVGKGDLAVAGGFPANGINIPSLPGMASGAQEEEENDHTLGVRSPIGQHPLQQRVVEIISFSLPAFHRGDGEPVDFRALKERGHLAPDEIPDEG